MTYDHEALKKAAVTFRKAIERCRDRLTFPEMKKSFPKGCCKTASFLLAQYLIQERGCSPITCISGINPNCQGNPLTHLWLEYSSTLIDITADQFSGVNEPAIVTDDRSWHDKTFPEQGRFDFETEGGPFEDSYRDKFNADYSVILGVLLHPLVRDRKI